MFLDEAETSLSCAHDIQLCIVLDIIYTCKTTCGLKKAVQLILIRLLHTSLHRDTTVTASAYSCRLSLLLRWSLHDDDSYEYGDFCVRLHRGDAVFTPIRFRQRPCTLLQLLNVPA